MSVADHAIPVLQLDDLIKHQAQKKKTGQKKTEQKAGGEKVALAQASVAWLPCYLSCSAPGGVLFVLLALQWSLLCLWSYSMSLLCSAFVHLLSARHCSASQCPALGGLQGRHSRAVHQYNFIGRLLAGVALQGQCSIQMSPRPIAVSTRGQPVCTPLGCLGRKQTLLK